MPAFFKLNGYPITPYLTLPDRISQLWINRYTLILIFIVIKLVLFKRALKSALKISESYTKLTCQSLSNYSSALSSLPYYMTQLSNQLITKSINEANKGLLETLELIVQGTEETILFAIDMVIGTYTCVLTATVDGALGTAINATEAVIDVANKTVTSLADEIQDGIEDLESVVNGILKLADKVADLVTGNDDASANVDFDKVNSALGNLKSWKIDSSVNDKLTYLGDHLPDFADVEQFTESLIDKPFSKVIQEINSSNYDIIQSYELKTAFSKASTSQVISPEEIENFYTLLSDKIDMVTKVMIILLVLLAILIIIPLIWKEYKNWCRATRLSEDKTMDSLTKIMVYENRYTSLIGDYLSKFSTPYKMHIKWLVLYVSSHDSLILLAVGLTGLAVLILQYIIISCILGDPSLANSLSKFASNIDQSMVKDIDQWTQAVNDVIYEKQEDINDNLFSWVEDSTLSINNTINGFVDKMDEAILVVFNNTPLYTYVQNVVGCVIINKLERVEEGLTWVHEHAEITLPLIDGNLIIDILNNEPLQNSTTAYNETLKIDNYKGNQTTSTNNSTSLLINDNNSVDILSKTEASLEDAFKSLVDEYKKSILLEFYISLILIGIWIMQLLVGLGILYLKDLQGERQREQEFNLNIDLTRYDISSPIQMTNSQEQIFTNDYGKVSDPFQKVKVKNTFPHRPQKELVDETLNDLITKDKLVYGGHLNNSEEDEEDDEGVSEILSYDQDRNLTDQRISKRWIL